ncbi:hypothetical protein ACFQU2_23140 [Siccirubricoccus deserti]
MPTSSPWTDPGAAAASQGWGDTQGSQGYDGQDASAGGYDSDSGYDTGGSMDDAGGGYDEEI